MNGLLTASQSAMRCPYCQTPIGSGLPVRFCPTCKLPHHDECWRANGGCTAFGCEHRPNGAAPPVEDEAPESEYVDIQLDLEPSRPARVQPRPAPAPSPVWNIPTERVRKPSRAWVGALVAVAAGIWILGLLGSHSVKPPPRLPPLRQQAADLYLQWVTAWQQRNLAAYLNCYAEDCLVYRVGTHPQNKGELAQRMGKDFGKKRYIRIVWGQVNIAPDGDIVRLSVWQEYDSNLWWDKGTKSLVMARRNGRLQIIKESFAMSSGGRKK